MYAWGMLPVFNARAGGLLERPGRRVGHHELRVAFPEILYSRGTELNLNLLLRPLDNCCASSHVVIR